MLSNVLDKNVKKLSVVFLIPTMNLPLLGISRFLTTLFGALPFFLQTYERKASFSVRFNGYGFCVMAPTRKQAGARISAVIRERNAGAADEGLTTRGNHTERHHQMK